VKRWKYQAAKIGVEQFAESVVRLIRSHIDPRG